MMYRKITVHARTIDAFVNTLECTGYTSGVLAVTLLSGYHYVYTPWGVLWQHPFFNSVLIYNSICSNGPISASNCTTNIKRKLKYYYLLLNATESAISTYKSESRFKIVTWTLI